MKTRLTGLLLAIILTGSANAQWVTVGNTGISTGQAEYTTIAIAPNGTPYLAFADDANGSRANVMKFDGNNWVSVGPPNFSNNVALPLSLALDAGGTPYVAFGDTAHKATVMKYNGSSWVTVGSSDFSDSGAVPNGLVIDGNGAPVVLCGGASSLNSVVMRFTGGNWSALGSSNLTTEDFNTTLAVDKNDNIPYIAYANNGTGQGTMATVKKFDGTNWNVLGTYEFTTAKYTSIAIGPNEKPYLAMQDNDSIYGKKATVMNFDGTDWVYMGNRGFSPGPADYTSLILDKGGLPYVVYVDDTTQRITVMKYNYTGWITVDSPNFSDSTYDQASLAIDLNSGVLYVAYADFSDGWKARVVKHGNIQGIADIKANEGFKLYPSPAQDKIIVEWRGTLSGNVNITVFDLLGNEMSNTKVDGRWGQTVINTTVLANGFYLVKLLADDGTALSCKMAIAK